MAVQVFPQGKSDNERNLIELVRLAADLPAGLVAYSAICTHLGCTVLPQLSEQGYIVCPCHGSIFDPAADAAGRPRPGEPTPASPAHRGLPGWGRTGRRWIRGTSRTGLMVTPERYLPGAPR